MHSKSDNVKTMIYTNANEVFDKLFKSILSKYQENFEK